MMNRARIAKLSTGRSIGAITAPKNQCHHCVPAAAATSAGGLAPTKALFQQKKQHPFKAMARNDDDELPVSMAKNDEPEDMALDLDGDDEELDASKSAVVTKKHTGNLNDENEEDDLLDAYPMDEDDLTELLKKAKQNGAAGSNSSIPDRDDDYGDLESTGSDDAEQMAASLSPKKNGHDLKGDGDEDEDFQGSLDSFFEEEGAAAALNKGMDGDESTVIRDQGAKRRGEDERAEAAKFGTEVNMSARDSKQPDLAVNEDGEVDSAHAASEGLLSFGSGGAISFGGDEGADELVSGEESLESKQKKFRPQVVANVVLELKREHQNRKGGQRLSCCEYLTSLPIPDADIPWLNATSCQAVLQACDYFDIPMDYNGHLPLMMVKAWLLCANPGSCTSIDKEKVQERIKEFAAEDMPNLLHLCLNMPTRICADENPDGLQTSLQLFATRYILPEIKNKIFQFSTNDDGTLTPKDTIGALQLAVLVKCILRYDDQFGMGFLHYSYVKHSGEPEVKKEVLRDLDGNEIVGLSGLEMEGDHLRKEEEEFMAAEAKRLAKQQRAESKVTVADLYWILATMRSKVMAGHALLDQRLTFMRALTAWGADIVFIEEAMKGNIKAVDDLPTDIDVHGDLRRLDAKKKAEAEGDSLPDDRTRAHTKNSFYDVENMSAAFAVPAAKDVQRAEALKNICTKPVTVPSPKEGQPDVVVHFSELVCMVARSVLDHDVARCRSWQLVTYSQCCVSLMHQHYEQYIRDRSKDVNWIPVSSNKPQLGALDLDDPEQLIVVLNAIMERAMTAMHKFSFQDAVLFLHNLGRWTQTLLRTQQRTITGFQKGESPKHQTPDQIKKLLAQLKQPDEALKMRFRANYCAVVDLAMNGKIVPMLGTDNVRERKELVMLVMALENIYVAHDPVAEVVHDKASGKKKEVNTQEGPSSKAVPTDPTAILHQPVMIGSPLAEILRGSIPLDYLTPVAAAALLKGVAWASKETIRFEDLLPAQRAKTLRPPTFYTVQEMLSLLTGLNNLYQQTEVPKTLTTRRMQSKQAKGTIAPGPRHFLGIPLPVLTQMIPEIEFRVTVRQSSRDATGLTFENPAQVGVVCKIIVDSLSEHCRSLRAELENSGYISSSASVFRVRETPLVLNRITYLIKKLWVHWLHAGSGSNEDMEKFIETCVVYDKTQLEIIQILQGTPDGRESPAVQQPTKMLLDVISTYGENMAQRPMPFKESMINKRKILEARDRPMAQLFKRRYEDFVSVASNPSQYKSVHMLGWRLPTTLQLGASSVPSDISEEAAAVNAAIAKLKTDTDKPVKISDAHRLDDAGKSAAEAEWDRASAIASLKVAKKEHFVGANVAIKKELQRQLDAEHGGPIRPDFPAQGVSNEELESKIQQEADIPMYSPTQFMSNFQLMNPRAWNNRVAQSAAKSAEKKSATADLPQDAKDALQQQEAGEVKHLNAFLKAQGRTTLLLDNHDYREDVSGMHFMEEQDSPEAAATAASMGTIGMANRAPRQAVSLGHHMEFLEKTLYELISAQTSKGERLSKQKSSSSTGNYQDEFHANMLQLVHSCIDSPKERMAECMQSKERGAYQYNSFLMQQVLNEKVEAFKAENPMLKTGRKDVVLKDKHGMIIEKKSVKSQKLTKSVKASLLVGTIAEGFDLSQARSNFNYIGPMAFRSIVSIQKMLLRFPKDLTELKWKILDFMSPIFALAFENSTEAHRVLFPPIMVPKKKNVEAYATLPKQTQELRVGEHSISNAASMMVNGHTKSSFCFNTLITYLKAKAPTPALAPGQAPPPVDEFAGAKLLAPEFVDVVMDYVVPLDLMSLDPDVFFREEEVDAKHWTPSKLVNIYFLLPKETWNVRTNRKKSKDDEEDVFEALRETMDSAAAMDKKDMSQARRLQMTVMKSIWTWLNDLKSGRPIGISPVVPSIEEARKEEELDALKMLATSASESHSALAATAVRILCHGASGDTWKHPRRIKLAIWNQQHKKALEVQEARTITRIGPSTQLNTTVERMSFTGGALGSAPISDGMGSLAPMPAPGHGGFSEEKKASASDRFSKNRDKSSDIVAAPSNVSKEEGNRQQQTNFRPNYRRERLTPESLRDLMEILEKTNQPAVAVKLFNFLPVVNMRDTLLSSKCTRVWMNPACDLSAISGGKLGEILDHSLIFKSHTGGEIDYGQLSAREALNATVLALKNCIYVLTLTTREKSRIGEEGSALSRPSGRSDMLGRWFAATGLPLIHGMTKILFTPPRAGTEVPEMLMENFTGVCSLITTFEWDKLSGVDDLPNLMFTKLAPFIRVSSTNVSEKASTVGGDDILNLPALSPALLDAFVTNERVFATTSLQELLGVVRFQLQRLPYTAEQQAIVKAAISAVNQKRVSSKGIVFQAQEKNPVAVAGSLHTSWMKPVIQKLGELVQGSTHEEHLFETVHTLSSFYSMVKADSATLQGASKMDTDWVHAETKALVARAAQAYMEQKRDDLDTNPGKVYLKLGAGKTSNPDGTPRVTRSKASGESLFAVPQSSGKYLRGSETGIYQVRLMCEDLGLNSDGL